MSIFSHLSRSSNTRLFGVARGKRSYSRAKAGFTLIELLVVMAIMVIVTGIMLVRQSKFDSSTLLRSLAYSVALSVRQGQIYGTSVLGTNVSGTVVYASAYGLYFNGTNSQYILFADLNNNGHYDSGEDVKVFTLNSGYTISNFCATQTGNTPWCWNAGNGTITQMSIMFKRPNPDACFATDATAGTWSVCGPGGTPLYSSASVQISSNGDAGSTRSVYISSTGEISVGAPGT